MVRIWTLLLVVVALLPCRLKALSVDEVKAADEERAAAADEVNKTKSGAQQAPKNEGWRFGVSFRGRMEWWDWFHPGTSASGKQNEYAFFGGYFRFNAQRSGKRIDFSAEASVPVLLGLPEDATAPPPQGQLGLGAAYRAANGDRPAYIFVRQANVTFKGVAGKNANLRLGRFEFIEGQESLTQDPTLDWIKRERIAHRLIGNFAFSHVQRTADGAQFFINSRGTNVTVVGARPTVGVFELNGNKEVPNVEYVYSGVTHTGASK